MCIKTKEERDGIRQNLNEEIETLHPSPHVISSFTWFLSLNLIRHIYVHHSSTVYFHFRVQQLFTLELNLIRTDIFN